MLKNCFCFAGMLQIMPQNGKVLSWNVAPQEHVFCACSLAAYSFSNSPTGLTTEKSNGLVPGCFHKIERKRMWPSLVQSYVHVAFANW